MEARTKARLTKLSGTEVNYLVGHVFNGYYYDKPEPGQMFLFFREDGLSYTCTTRVNDVADIEGKIRFTTRNSSYELEMLGDSVNQ